MSLTKIRNSESVIHAIKEFDILGRDNFLKKYGFDKAREYYLLHNGQYYDSKAIIGVAFGFENPSHGPLKPSEFSGGKNTVQKKLEELGFTVVRIPADRVRKRNPSRRKPWSWAECYLAVWGYDKIDRGDYDTKKQVAIDISELIGRTWKSVEYKFQNIAHFDSRGYNDKPYSPKRHAQELLGEVFKWYWSNRAKNRLFFDDIIHSLDAPPITDFKKGFKDVTKKIKNIMVEEGGIKENTVRMRQRSTQLVKEARKHHRELDKEGKLRCTICGYVKPAVIDREIVHIHHIQPLMEKDEEGEVIPLEKAIENTIPLCPICHALAHTERPPLSIRKIMQILL